jgi:cell division protein FtsN
MNRIITILVTIFILLLLYIWISHVWGPDTPRHPKQIVDATEHGITDDAVTDPDTSVIHDLTASETDGTEEPANADEFRTERVVNEDDNASPSETTTKPAAEKKEETKPVVKQEEKPKVTSAPPKTTTTTTSAKPADTSPKTNTAPAKTVSTPAASGDGGKHLVIAGNFSQLSNAQQRAAELKKAGFTDAEVVQFDLSEYHTVCAGRFSDVNEARKLVKKLKDYHKIDAYVRIGS